MNGLRNIRGYGRVLLALGWIAAMCGGCDSQAAKDFRAASRSQLETGVNSVVDGLLDGVFALWEPDTTSSANTSAGQ